MRFIALGKKCKSISITAFGIRFQHPPTIRLGKEFLSEVLFKAAVNGHLDATVYCKKLASLGYSHARTRIRPHFQTILSVASDTSSAARPVVME